MFCRRLKNYQCQYREAKRSQNLAPVLVTNSGNSLEFSRKIIASTGFYRCCAPGASAPVVVKNQSPILGNLFHCDSRVNGALASPILHVKSPQ